LIFVILKPEARGGLGLGFFGSPIQGEEEPNRRIRRGQVSMRMESTEAIVYALGAELPPAPNPELKTLDKTTQ